MTGAANAASPVEAFRQFVSAINRHDVGALVALMTADHVFVDSMGNRAQGAASMEVGCRLLHHVSGLLDSVLAVGEAGGMIAGVEWRTPAAWEAVIRGGAVSQWRVFADNKPVYEILARREG